MKATVTSKCSDETQQHLEFYRNKCRWSPHEAIILQLVWTCSILQPLTIAAIWYRAVGSGFNLAEALYSRHINSRACRECPDGLLSRVKTDKMSFGF